MDFSVIYTTVCDTKVLSKNKSVLITLLASTSQFFFKFCWIRKEEENNLYNETDWWLWCAALDRMSQDTTSSAPEKISSV